MIAYFIFILYNLAAYQLTSVDTKYKMTARTLIERQQFIEEEVKKLMNRRGIIMGGFLTL